MRGNLYQYLLKMQFKTIVVSIPIVQSLISMVKRTQTLINIDMQADLWNLSENKMSRETKQEIRFK